MSQPGQPATSLALWTIVPCSWQTVDASIMANMPSDEDWGSHIHSFRCDRDERYPGAWVVYKLSSNPACPTEYGRHGVLEVLSKNQDATIVRIWVASPGPSGRKRHSYTAFPFVDAEYIIRDREITTLEEKDMSLLQNSFQWLLSLVATFLRPLVPLSDESTPSTGQRSPTSVPTCLQELVQQGESATLEFKSTLQWDMVHRHTNKGLRLPVLKTVAAFLNSAGGTPVIGIEDDGRVCGLEEDLNLLGRSRDKFEQLLTSLIADKIGAHVAPFICIGFPHLEGKVVCAVVVDPAQEPVFLSERSGKSFYARVGNTTRLLDTEEATKYIRTNWG